MTAVTHVGISRKNWLASLQTHYEYPKKDIPLHSLYKELLKDFKNSLLEEHVKFLSAESMGPAWRWLVLRDTELEDKMVQIIQKGDRSLYHRIKAYEQAKTEDQLHNDFSVDLNIFLGIERHYKLKEDDSTIQFENELNEMIEGKDQSWLGNEIRLKLWREIDDACVIGPILYEQISDENVSPDDCKYRIAIGPFCRILELLDTVCTPRLRQLRQRITEARRETFIEANWERHANFLHVIGF